MAEAPQKFSFSFWNSAKIILALLLVWFVLSKTNLMQLFSLRAQISLPWLVIGILLYFILTLLKALQYYFLFGRRVDYMQVLNIVVVQNAISNFIATGAGIASYFALFRMEQGVKVSRAALAFILAKIGDLISIWLLLLVTSVLVWRQVNAFHKLIFALLSTIGGAILFFFLFIFMRRKFISLLQSLVQRIKLNRVSIIIKGMDIMQSLAEQKHGFVLRMVGVGILFSLVYMSVTMLWIYAGFQTFTFPIEVLPVVFVNIFMQLVSYLPIQVFGGLGVNETTSLYIYSFFNLPQAQAEVAAVLIAARLLFYITNLLVLLYLPLHVLVLDRAVKK